MTSDTEESQKGYALFQIEVTDHDRFAADYVPPTMETIEAHGGRVLVSVNTEVGAFIHHQEDSPSVSLGWVVSGSAVISREGSPSSLPLVDRASPAKSAPSAEL